MLLMLVALWVAWPQMSQPLAGVALGSGYSYTYVTSFDSDCIAEPAPSLDFACTLPLEGEPLHLRLKYTDPMRNYWTGCTATYRGATFCCQSSMQSPQFALIAPEMVGISAERAAELRRQYFFINQHTDDIWLGVIVYGAGALALLAGLYTLRRKVKLTFFGVVSSLTTAFFIYWFSATSLYIYFATLHMLD